MNPPILQGRVVRRLPQQVRAVLALILGFATLIAIGTVLLVTPFAASDGRATTPVEALFTSVSATSDTGLTVLDTGDHWSPFGELVLVVLMFAGGVGIMASATLAVLLGRRATLDRRAQVSDAFGGSLGSARDVVRGTVAFAAGVQAVGVIAFIALFLLDGSQLPTGGPIWNAIFQ